MQRLYKITNKRISFEYALAKDNNDNLDDAKQLINLLKGMLCHDKSNTNK